MSDDDTQTYIRVDPVTHDREIVTEYRESSAGWWAAGIVAVVLVIAGAFVLTHGDRADRAAAIRAAAAQGRAEGVMEGGQAAIAGQTAGAVAATNQAETAGAQAAAGADPSASGASATLPDAHGNPGAAQ